MFDEKKLEDISEKITQAVRIKSGIIEDNSKAIALIGSKDKESRIKGAELLMKNCEREENLLAVLDSGARETINILFDFNSGVESKFFGPETKRLINIISDSMDYFINKSVKLTVVRLEYERKYLDEYSYFMEKYYLIKFKNSWNKELLADRKLYKMLSHELESNERFWSDILKKIKQLPKGELSKQLKTAFVMNNIYPFFVANSLTPAFVIFGPDMDTADKAIFAAIIWNLSGFLSRVTHVIVTFKNIYGLADATYQSKIINELKPKNILIK